jgi:hypothetical protein
MLKIVLRCNRLMACDILESVQPENFTVDILLNN